MRAFVVLATVVAVGLAYTSFTASVTISNDPAIWGNVAGTMSYYYDTTSAGKHWRYMDYKVDGGSVDVKEWIDFGNTTRYLYCSSCQAETYPDAQDIFFPQSTDTLVSGVAPVGGCNKYTRTGDKTGITTVWATGTDKTTNYVCAVVYSTGKRIDFSGYTDTNALSPTSTVFTALKSKNCPAKVCNVVMNLVIVLDESGSIDDDEWDDAVSFATTLIGSFTVNSDAVMIGVVFFTTDSRIITYLTDSSSDAIKKIKNAKQIGGTTCMPCGVNSAITVFNAETSTRAAMNPSDVMVLVTDGYNNRPQAPWWFRETSSDTYCNRLLYNATKKIKANGVTCLSVGVGTDLSKTELNMIASSSSYVLTVSGYSQLYTIIDMLVKATCTEFPTEPCGSTCRGFCTCSKTCICASSCPDLGKCFSYKCVDGANWNGCQATALSCNDNKACTVDTCDNSTGCKHTTLNCDDNNPCTNDFCDNATGCYHTANTCDDGLVCTTDTCDTKLGCQHTATKCNDGKSCTADVCIEGVGCTYTTNCSDDSACTDDFCDANGKCAHTTITCTAPNLCYTAKCMPATGCVTEYIDCEDGNICTDNTCLPASGCQNKTIADCAACLAVTAPNCTAMNTLCTTYHCETVKDAKNNSVATCVGVNKTQTTCNSNDLCIDDFCDEKTGDCSHKNYYDVCANNEPDKCLVATCTQDKGGHLCTATPKVCTAVDACHTAICDNATGNCKQVPICPDKNCFTTSCNVIAASPFYECKYTDIDCSSGSACLTGKCNLTTGSCYNTQVQCDDGKFCTIDSCDPATGCVHANNTCTDNDPCTVDKCLEDVDKCDSTTPLCNDGKFCTDDACGAGGVCSYTTHSCTSAVNLTSSEENCYVAACSETAHCFKQIIKGAFTNACGGCVATFQSSHADTTCIGDLALPVFAGALAAGIIAAIVIAAIIGFLIFAAASAFGTWKLIQMSKAGNNMAATNNPMYKPSDNESVNPAYATR